MKIATFMVVLIVLISCATQKPRFVKENVCTSESLKYLRNPRNKSKRAILNKNIPLEILSSTKGMQLCYEDFKKRTGFEEFNTCLVVGVDEVGKTEFYNFGSREIKLDHEFMSCARSVTQAVPYSQYGSNYILIQAYQFYISDT